MDSARSTPLADESALRALYSELMAGWNQGNADAFAATFADDGDLVGFDGTHLHGRAEIAAFHRPLFEKWLKGTRLVGVIVHVRFLRSDVALMHAIGSTVMPGKSSPAPERDSIQTLVATKQAGAWRMAAFQNTRTRPMRQSAANTLVWLFSDWLWRLFGRAQPQ